MTTIAFKLTNRLKRVVFDREQPFYSFLRKNVPVLVYGCMMGAEVIVLTEETYKRIVLPAQRIAGLRGILTFLYVTTNDDGRALRDGAIFENAIRYTETYGVPPAVA